MIAKCRLRKGREHSGKCCRSEDMFATFATKRRRNCQSAWQAAPKIGSRPTARVNLSDEAFAELSEVCVRTGIEYRFASDSDMERFHTRKPATQIKGRSKGTVELCVSNE